MPEPTTFTGGLHLPIALRERSGGGALVVVLHRGGLVAVDQTTGDQALLTTLVGRLRAFDLSPDGSKAYAGGTPSASSRFRSTAARQPCSHVLLTSSQSPRLPQWGARSAPQEQ
ncbi:hypothetical protein ALI22I_00205 [Saccharothrix sp. ALI-22-I]|nr:hypothetical protein ALI22I_00205 [Saccharothrix sp. ALI-22-I]